jgi:hypothetical protein
MKVNAISAVCSYATIALFLSGSCNKIDEERLYLENGKADLRQCVIKKITFGMDTNEGGVANFMTFTYNERKDPVLGTPRFVATGSPKWVFYYDGKGRLIHFAGLYNGNPNFEFWHNYFYDDQDRIIGDSIYNLGIIGQPGRSAQSSYETFTYDKLNRINHETITGAYNPFNLPPADYTYDIHGNLFGTTQHYDDKVNLLLTNKIWRFINRDYSLNNLVTADAYNDHGLPVLYSKSTGGPDFALFDFYVQFPVSIEYDCQ